MKLSTPHVTLCTGFMQTIGKPNGLSKLADRLHSVEGLTVEPPLKWDSDPDGYADWVTRNYEDDAPHFIVGYSYGANTALTMCRELQKQERRVDGLFLIDGVKRMRTAKFLWVARALSLWKWQKLVAPSNVYQCAVWRQREGAPKGHPVFCKLYDLTLEIADTTFLKLKHSDMDDEPRIHDAITNRIDAAVESHRRSARGK